MCLDRGFQVLLGLTPQWQVVRVDIDPVERTARVEVGCAENRPGCPVCGAVSRRHDRRRREWRQVDTMLRRTFVSTDLPRVRCAEHGVRQVRAPWAEPGLRFTVLFESLVIAYLREASFSAVPRLPGLSRDEVAGIRKRAVDRGLSRRRLTPPREIGVDETSFQKRHEYVTVVNDQAGRVLYVADGRDTEALDGFFEALGAVGCARIERVAMDMAPAYLRSVRAHTGAEIVFDEFQVAKMPGDAVNRVRREEHRELMRAGDDRLLRTRTLWLQNESNMTRSRRAWFRELRDSELRVARQGSGKEWLRSRGRGVMRGVTEERFRYREGSPAGRFRGRGGSGPAGFGAMGRLRGGGR